jgi:hypothetical protein
MPSYGCDHIHCQPNLSRSITIHKHHDPFTFRPKKQICHITIYQNDTKRLRPALRFPAKHVLVDAWIRTSGGMFPEREGRVAEVS